VRVDHDLVVVPEERGVQRRAVQPHLAVLDIEQRSVVAKRRHTRFMLIHRSTVLTSTAAVVARASGVTPARITVVRRRSFTCPFSLGSRGRFKTFEGRFPSFGTSEHVLPGGYDVPAAKDLLVRIATRNERSRRLTEIAPECTPPRMRTRLAGYAVGCLPWLIRTADA